MVFPKHLADTAVVRYNTVDPRERTGAARWHRVDLAPGDALLTPVGWWHHVEALTPSFSVSFSRFRWPNAFPWFVAGRS
ncbi:MAG: cupin-like domain-containing protein [Myxococcota bacterium]